VARNSFSYSGTELEALAGARNYYRWIYRRFAPYLGRRTVEIGAGVGTFGELLLTQPNIEELVLVEPAANLFPLLRERFSQQPRVRLVHGHVDALPVSISADCIIVVNVLEHVADVPTFLQALNVRLAPAGRLLVFVPAGPWLFGTLDTAFGHYRRYTATTLARSVEAAGFRIESLFYFNLPGVVTWFIAGRVLRKTTLSRRDVQLYDRWVVPWIVALESLAAPPLGQSLVAITQKRTALAGSA
jgi:SAM-dependent methyltransferase